MNLESSPSIGLTPRLPETQRASEPIGRLLSFKKAKEGLSLFKDKLLTTTKEFLSTDHNGKERFQIGRFVRRTAFAAGLVAAGYLGTPIVDKLRGSSDSTVQAQGLSQELDPNTYCLPGKSPEFVHGNAALKVVLGDTMGSPITCEYPDPNGTGDVHLKTDNGLGFWRKSTNTATFTNGYDHWALVPQGTVHWVDNSIEPTANASLWGAEVAAKIDVASLQAQDKQEITAAGTSAHPLKSGDDIGPIQSLEELGIDPATGKAVAETISNPEVASTPETTGEKYYDHLNKGLEIIDKTTGPFKIRIVERDPNAAQALLNMVSTKIKDDPENALPERVVFVDVDDPIWSQIPTRDFVAGSGSNTSKLYRYSYAAAKDQLNTTENGKTIRVQHIAFYPDALSPTQLIKLQDVIQPGFQVPLVLNSLITFGANRNGVNDPNFRKLYDQAPFTLEWYDSSQPNASKQRLNS